MKESLFSILFRCDSRPRVCGFYDNSMLSFPGSTDGAVRVVFTFYSFTLEAHRWRVWEMVKRVGIVNINNTSSFLKLMHIYIYKLKSL